MNISAWGYASSKYFALYASDQGDQPDFSPHDYC